MKTRTISLVATLCTGLSFAALAATDGPQATFKTPDEAVSALIATLEKQDTAELKHLLGPGTDDLISSGDDVADRNARDAFLARFKAKHQLVSGGPNDIVLQVGEDDWPMPVPLVKENGAWRFDGAAGVDEIVARRIGANELHTIDVLRGYVDAQNDYAAESHDGVPKGAYAQKLKSDPGKHNGLYWEAKGDEPESPAGPFLADAQSEGYSAKGTRAPYHGYVYRALKSQGANADGGARAYVVDGKQTGGFAAIAMPDDYGTSGVMTFIVNQDGIVYQRDLGDDTEKLAAAIDTFDPDSSWTALPPEAEE
jgi:hypothetical protein